jgi:hypothetical protein
MKNNKFYIVRTNPKFNQIIVEKENSMLLIHIYMTAHLTGSEQGLQRCGKMERVL